MLSERYPMQKAGAAAAEDAAEDEDAEDVAVAGANFDYLLDMALKSLTEEKVPGSCCSDRHCALPGHVSRKVHIMAAESPCTSRRCDALCLTYVNCGGSAVPMQHGPPACAHMPGQCSARKLGSRDRQTGCCR